MTITLKEKAPLVVPPSVQRKARLKAGDQVVFQASPGKITIVSGTGPGANPDVTVTYNVGYASNPTVVISYGVGAVASGTRLYRVNSSTSTGFTLVLEGTPNASTTYDLYYLVIGQT